MSVLPTRKNTSADHMNDVPGPTVEETMNELEAEAPVRAKNILVERYRGALEALRDLTDRPWEEVDPDEHIAIIDAALYPAVVCAHCEDTGRVWESCPRPGHTDFCPAGCDWPGEVPCLNCTTEATDA